MKKYQVFVAAGNSVLRVGVESDEKPRTDGTKLLIGESWFKQADVMAVVPEDVFQGSATSTPG